MWNENSQVYQLDFGGRVTQESAKNFQIEFRGKQVGSATVPMGLPNLTTDLSGLAGDAVRTNRWERVHVGLSVPLFRHPGVWGGARERDAAHEIIDSNIRHRPAAECPPVTTWPWRGQGRP